jgi:hypothetical protein
VPILPPPPVSVDCKDSIDCGSNATPAKGACVAGKCMCSNGYSGTLCEQFTCKLPINCNEAAGGGKCTGANTCTCNAGFSGADCLANCTTVNNCSGHGFCAAEGVCQCDPGFGKAAGQAENDCSAMLSVGMACQTNATCPTGVCWKANAADASGVCCASACEGECNSCSTGVCAGLLNVPCKGDESSMTVTETTTASMNVSATTTAMATTMATIVDLDITDADTPVDVGLVVGIVVSVLACIAVIAGAMLLLYYRHFAKKDSNDNEKEVANDRLPEPDEIYGPIGEIPHYAKSADIKGNENGYDFIRVDEL